MISQFGRCAVDPDFIIAAPFVLRVTHSNHLISVERSQNNRGRLSCKFIESGISTGIFVGSAL